MYAKVVHVSKKILWIFVFLFLISSAYALNITYPLNGSNIYYNTSLMVLKDNNTDIGINSFKMFIDSIEVYNISNNISVADTAERSSSATLRNLPYYVYGHVFDSVSLSMRESTTTPNAYLNFTYSDGTTNTSTLCTHPGAPATVTCTFTNPYPNKVVNQIVEFYYSTPSDCSFVTGLSFTYENTTQPLTRSFYDLYSIFNSTGNYSLNVSAYNLSNELINYSILNISIPFNSILNISVYDNFSLSNINNFTAYLVDVDSTYYALFTTVNGSVSFEVKQGRNYSLMIIFNEGSYDDYLGNVSSGSVYDFINISVFPKNHGIIYLINELNNSYFNCSSLHSCKLYYGNSNVSVYDFKASGTYTYLLSGGSESKLRLELVYPITLDTITRYIDLSTIVERSNIRICANPINTTHYEMVLYSASQRAVSMLNPYADCLVASDFTRFAYQDSFILRALTLDAPYFLYTIDGSVQTFLVGIDGSVESFINLDTLEFRSRDVGFGVLGDSLHVISNLTSSSSLIYYINDANDNVNGSLTIEDSINGTIFIYESYIFNPNNFTAIFDYSALNISNSSLFKVTVCFSKLDGDSKCVHEFFTPLASVPDEGDIPPALSLTIAILLIVFGFFTTQAKYVFSWFGIIMLVFALVVLALAPLRWYTLFLMGIDLIYLLWLGIFMGVKNMETVT